MLHHIKRRIYIPFYDKFLDDENPDVCKNFLLLLRIVTPPYTIFIVCNFNSSNNAPYIFVPNPLDVYPYMEMNRYFRILLICASLRLSVSISITNNFLLTLAYNRWDILVKIFSALILFEFFTVLSFTINFCFT